MIRSPTPGSAGSSSAESRTTSSRSTIQKWFRGVVLFALVLLPVGGGLSCSDPVVELESLEVDAEFEILDSVPPRLRAQIVLTNLETEFVTTQASSCVLVQIHEEDDPGSSLLWEQAVTEDIDADCLRLIFPLTVPGETDFRPEILRTEVSISRILEESDAQGQVFVFVRADVGGKTVTPLAGELDLEQFRE